MLITILVFILILGLLIFVHELGHFITAKRAGIRVDEFGFGFPPRIWGIKKGETIYSINLFPIGGFVKIYGEEGKGKKDPRSFASKPALTRAWILVAGVLMNFLLAAVLLSVGFFMGLPEEISDNQQNISNPQVQILQTAPNSPASQAGILMGDTIASLQFGDQILKTTKVGEVQDFISQHQGQEIIIGIQRGSEFFEKKLIPRENPPANEGLIGIALARTALVSYPWYQALYKGFISTFQLTLAIIVALAGLIWSLITTGHLMAEIGGPVKIFVLTGQAAKLGLIYILQFAALININIAIINIFPIPALDGGRLLFLLIEKIKGSPISQKIEGYAHTAGFALLILLMIAITWRDVVNHF